jgi:hypothetical protein
MRENIANIILIAKAGDDEGKQDNHINDEAGELENITVRNRVEIVSGVAEREQCDGEGKIGEILFV